MKNLPLPLLASKINIGEKRHTSKSIANCDGQVLFVVADIVLLLRVFGKNEKANLTPAERADIKRLISLYRDALIGH